MNGGAGYIKDEICPKVQYLTYQNIPELLKEISDKTNVKWFQVNGRFWLHSLSFNSEHQKLDKKGVDKLPSYSPELVPDKSETTPELVEIKSPLNTNTNTNTKAKATPELSTPVDNSAQIEASKPPAFLKEKPPEPKKPANERDEKRAAFMAELKSAIESAKDKYSDPYAQRAILLFVESNIRNKNPGAILHCINSLIKNPTKVTLIQKWLESALAAEDLNYNEKDEENRCNDFKKPGLFSFAELMNGIQLHAAQA
jgi:hypothetical protein